MSTRESVKTLIEKMREHCRTTAKVFKVMGDAHAAHAESADGTAKATHTIQAQACAEGMASNEAMAEGCDKCSKEMSKADSDGAGERDFTKLVPMRGITTVIPSDVPTAKAVPRYGQPPIADETDLSRVPEQFRKLVSIEDEV